MYVFGFDIPLVELIFVLAIIIIIILLEITAILILMSYYMKTAKKLSSEIKELTEAIGTAGRRK